MPQTIQTAADQLEAFNKAVVSAIDKAPTLDVKFQLSRILQDVNQDFYNQQRGRD